MSSPRSTGATQTQRHHSSRRDAAMARVGSITRTIGVGSVVAVAALGIYLSRALPGHKTTTSSGAGAATVPSGATSNGSVSTGNSGNSAGNTGNSGGLASPSSPPAQAQQQAPVVSGSS